MKPKDLVFKEAKAPAKPKKRKNQELVAFPHLPVGSEIPEPYDIFGQYSKKNAYISSEQMWNQDREKAIAAAQIANASGAPNRTQKWHESFLEAYLGENIALQHIQVGFNRAGKSYRNYGYQYKWQINRKPVQKKVAAVLASEENSENQIQIDKYAPEK